MNRLIRIGILWCLAISIASAQEADTSKDGSFHSNPDEPQAEGSASANSKAVMATTMAAETVLPVTSPIRVTLRMRKDESYEKIEQLIEALKDAGVKQMSFSWEGVSTEGEEERNTLILHLPQGFTLGELQKIESAANAKAVQCGLRLFIVTQNLAQPAGEFFEPAVPQLRTDYEAANKQAHGLAESLQQTPDAAKKAELRTAVQRAFTLRQSLLRAELQEMQARLEKTQQSLDMRDHMADQIVDRRVEDLLNPELKWDDSALPSTKDSSPKIGTAARYNADADGDNLPERTGFSEISLRIPEKQFVPDPGTPALRVTYDDLDLFKILNLEPVPANAVENFPDWLQALNGKTIRIRGFMYPTFEAHSLKQFTLARHNDICCFVRNPKIYDVIGVSLGEGITTDYIDGRPFDVEGTFNIEPKTDEGKLTHLYRISEARILPVAAEDTDLQNEDLSKAQADGVNDDPMQITGPINSAANALATPETAGPATELEGDWHRVAYIDKWQTERRSINMTIRANQENSALWTGESYSRTVVIDQNAKTIEVGANELKGGLPNQVVSERGTYTLTEDLLTIHSEITISDAVSGAVLQKGQHTNIWKRGLCKIENYDGRNPGHGMGICHLNGSDENTGLGKLLPGDNVDVFVSFASKEGPPVQRVLVESIEVDGSIEPKQDRPEERQIRLLGTREQCLIIDDANMRGVTLIVSQKREGKTQQFPGGINTDAVKEMKEVAPQKSLDVLKPAPFP